MKALLQINDIHKRYGRNVLFERANVALGSMHRVGVIGRNGAGKTTLCRLITGEEDLDDGQIIQTRGLRLGYLEQRDPFRPEETVLRFLARYTGKEEWQCGKVAGRFQLKNEVLQAEVGELSGGFQSRVKLAAMLLLDPNFLILDEPTNFLDLKTLLLFENFLDDFSGGFLIVSHDREFLKRACTHTLEVEHGKLALFPGSIEDYLEYKQEQIELVERHNRNVEAEQKRLQAYVDRFRAKARLASQAQSKLKMLNRLEKIEIHHSVRTVNIRIPQVESRKGIAVSCRDLSVGYPGNTVASSIYLEAERGRRLAILGDNGEGKTTFLRTIAGNLPPVSGVFQWGPGLKPAYYAQHVYQELNPEDTVLSHLSRSAAPDVLRQEVLDLAGSFLFSGDDVQKEIAVLSGGERARVCLAGLLLSKNPVLLLDEPTNHLDFEAVEALGVALRKYAGTILFTSHDRTFVNLVATAILEIRNGAITSYPDTYESYVFYLQNLCREETEEEPREEEDPSGQDEKPDYFRQKQRRSRLRKLKSQIGKVEERMAASEKERAAILQHFENNPTDYSRERQVRLEELNRIHEEAESTWLELHEEAETLEEEE